MKEEKNKCSCDNENNLEIEKSLVVWKEHHEDILIEWADKANCFKWLHNKSYLKYNYKRNKFTIPVIILSTLTGTANFAIERVPEEHRAICSIIIGSINIIAGIITTVAQFLKLNELSEGHKIATLSWDKFYRNIKIELLKSSDERIDVNYFIKYCKDEYDRLMETSPNIDNDILNLFKTKLTTTHDKNEKNVRLQVYNELNKPEIFDEIISIKYKVNRVNNNLDDIENEKLKLDKIIKKQEMLAKKRESIKIFVDSFENQYNRKPSQEEILENTIIHND